MSRMIASMVFTLACMACAAPPGPASAQAAVADAAVGEFTGPGGTIRVDPGHLTIAIGAETHPLVDCSNNEFHCFKNDSLGFHIVFPRSCATRPPVAGVPLGGAVFYEFAGVEHGDARSGRYASELSDRFAYVYFVDRGLAEIQYDPAGQARFGPRQANSTGYGAWRPYTYRSAEARAFLRCRP